MDWCVIFSRFSANIARSDALARPEKVSGKACGGDSPRQIETFLAITTLRVAAIARQRQIKATGSRRQRTTTTLSPRTAAFRIGASSISKAVLRNMKVAENRVSQFPPIPVQ